MKKVVVFQIILFLPLTLKFTVKSLSTNSHLSALTMFFSSKPMMMITLLTYHFDLEYAKLGTPDLLQ